MIIKNKSLLVIMIMFLCIVAIGCSPNNSQLFDEKYDLGILLLSEENYEEAIIAYEKAIEIDSTQAKAYIGLAETYIARLDTNTVEDVNKALKSGWENADQASIMLAYIDLADKLVAADRAGWAMSILDSGLTLTEDDRLQVKKSEISAASNLKVAIEYMGMTYEEIVSIFGTDYAEPDGYRGSWWIYYEDYSIIFYVGDEDKELAADDTVKFIEVWGNQLSIDGNFSVGTSKEEFMSSVTSPIDFIERPVYDSEEYEAGAVLKKWPYEIFIAFDIDGQYITSAEIMWAD